MKYQYRIEFDDDCGQTITHRFSSLAAARRHLREYGIRSYGRYDLAQVHGGTVHGEGWNLARHEDCHTLSIVREEWDPAATRRYRVEVVEVER